MWEQMRLFDSDGNELSEESDVNQAEILFSASKADTYYLLTSDGFRGLWTGGYNFYSQKVNNPAEATEINGGDTLSGSIMLVGEADTYTYSSAGDGILRLKMVRSSGSLWQKIRVYDPAGNLVGEDSGSVEAELQVQLAAEGKYTILVSDGLNGTLTGSYNITALKVR